MSPKEFLRRRLPRLLQWQQPKRHFSFERGREEGETKEGRLIFVSCQNPECAPQPWKDLACHAIPLPLQRGGDGKSALECEESAVSITFASLFSDAFNRSLVDEMLLPSTRPTWTKSVKAFSSSPFAFSLSLSPSRIRPFA